MHKLISELHILDSNCLDLSNCFALELFLVLRLDILDPQLLFLNCRKLTINYPAMAFIRVNSS